MDREQLNERLPSLIDAMVQSAAKQPHLQHLNRLSLPSRDAIIRSIHLLRELIFPGYFGRQELSSANLPQRARELMTELAQVLFEQVRCCLQFRESAVDDNAAAEALAIFFE